MSFSIRSAIIAGLILIFVSPGVSFADDNVPGCPGGTPPPCTTPVPTAENISTSTPYQTAITIQLLGALTAGSPEILAFEIVSNPPHGSLGSIQVPDNTVVYTPSAGYSGSDSFTYRSIDGQEVSLTATVSITVEAAPDPDTVSVTLRDGSLIIAASSSVQLSSDNNAVVSLTASGAPHDTKVNSVLGVLNAFDTASSDFAISDLQYFSSFSSFYVNCITAPADPGSPLCASWLYVVGGIDPGVGMDAKMLVDNDVVYVYFGSSRRVLLSATTAQTGESFTATAQSYNAVTNEYSPITTGATIGVKNSAGTEVSTSPVNGSGQASFSLNSAGSYTVGIVEDFYFPASSIAISTPAPAPSGGGGGVFIAQFDVPRAVSFLESQQRADGSFASTLLSDWAAIAFAVGGAAEQREKLRGFFASSTPLLSSVTDYERHAMALQALGINPYSSSDGTDYITHIANAFDGTQVGDAALVNDDIFALFPLMHAGYGANDEIIQKIASFIISKQQANGSWENSVDLTSAGIQALSMVNSLPNVPSSVTNARGYLIASPRINGGFGNEFSTGWALQAISSLGESPINWISGSLNPRDYLASLQQSNGGVGPATADIETKIWATAYAIPAVEGKTWDSLLSDFSKPAPLAAQIATTTEATSSQPSGTTSSILAAALSEATGSVIAKNVPLIPRKNINKIPNPLEPTTTTAPQFFEAVPTTTASQTAAVGQLAAAAGVSGSPLGIDWTFLVYLLALAAAGGMLASLYSLLKALIERFRK